MSVSFFEETILNSVMLFQSPTFGLNLALWFFFYRDIRTDDRYIQIYQIFSKAIVTTTIVIITYLIIKTLVSFVSH